MKPFLLRAGTLAITLIVGASCLCAQDWKTTESLQGVDLGGLTATQKASALKLLRGNGCGCGCNMKLAECRVVDPACSWSTGLAQVIVASLKQGKSESEALAAANSSKYAHRPEPKLLEDPVAIPVNDAPAAGQEKAAITVVEFSDFQCPYCAQAAPQVEALLKVYPLQVRIVFKQFPLDIHPQAAISAAASVAAQKQGKFWQMHDALFANRNDLSRKNILAMAQEVGMDMNRFAADLDSAAVHEIVERDVKDGDRIGVEGTPTVFINGQKFNGAIEVSAMKPVLDAELKKPAGPAQAVASSSGTAATTVKR